MNESLNVCINQSINEQMNSKLQALCPIFHCFRLQEIALCNAVNNLACTAVNNLASIIRTVNYSKWAGAQSNQGKLTKRNFPSRLDDRQALGWHDVTQNWQILQSGQSVSASIQLHLNSI